MATTYEQRKAFYRDVETLISPGFLTHPVKIQGIRLAFRSLSPGDLFLLRARAEGASDLEWQRWAIASSIWMVDGVNLLDDRNSIPRLYRLISSLPRSAHRALYGIVVGLFSKTEKASEAIEAFIYEDISRTRWRMLGKGLFGQGVPGADALGANFIQQIWMAFNQVEDDRLSSDKTWEGFKLVASTHAPKGVKKIDQRDKARSEEEQRRRQVIMDNLYLYRTGQISAEVFAEKRYVKPRAEAIQDLQEEMRKWVAGEMDEHDQIVSDYKSFLLERQQAVEAEREARRTQIRREVNTDSPIEPVGLVAYSPDQLAEILKHRPQGRVVYDENSTKKVTDKHLGVKS